MNKHFKRILSVFLVVLMAVSVVPLTGTENIFLPKASAIHNEVSYTQTYSSYWSNTYDNYWYNHSYGYQDYACTNPGTIATSGCGIMALVNAVAYMTDRFIDPCFLPIGQLIMGIGIMEKGLPMAYTVLLLIQAIILMG